MTWIHIATLAVAGASLVVSGMTVYYGRRVRAARRELSALTAELLIEHDHDRARGEQVTE